MLRGSSQKRFPAVVNPWHGGPPIEGKDFDFPEPVEVASGAIYKKSSFTLREAISDLELCDMPEIDHMRKEETGIQLERIHRFHKI